ncbi:hypothetical protein ACFL1B_06220 [Nanoarchaeota archaeon]
MLTLDDVGIPNYKEEDFKALPPIDKIAAIHIIRETGLTIDSPIPQSKWRHLVEDYQYVFWHEGKIAYTNDHSLISVIQEASQGEPLTFRDYVELLQSHAKEERSVNVSLRVLLPVLSSRNGPYFTNNFFLNFPEHVDREQAGPETLSILDRLTELTQGEDVISAIEQSSGLFTYEGAKATYPYFITLKREGFAPSKLMA